MNLAEITTAPLDAPADLIDLFESLVPWKAGRPPARWAFRGQSQSFGSLFPSIQRIFGQKKSVGAAEYIERDLIKTFREHYAKLDGITADMPTPNLIGTNFDLRCLSVMQHYGVPTRLVDWTSDFWTAIYFACAGDPSKEAELWFYNRDIFFKQQQSNDMAYLLRPSAENQFQPEPPILSQRDSEAIVELDPRITPRMKKQAAHHTLSTNVFSDHVPLLLELSQALEAPAGEYGHFHRILIAPECKDKALRFLAEQQEVTAGTIFPDVEGLGKFLHWHLESLVTTLLSKKEKII
jgi:hypothetical protein